MYLQHNHIQSLNMDENILTVQSGIDFNTSDKESLGILDNCESRMAGVIEGIKQMYSNLAILDEELTNHLEFLIAKKAASSKVLTVSGQILNLHETIEGLNSIAALLSYDGAP